MRRALIILTALVLLGGVAPAAQATQKNYNGGICTAVATLSEGPLSFHGKNYCYADMYKMYLKVAAQHYYSGSWHTLYSKSDSCNSGYDCAGANDSLHLSISLAGACGKFRTKVHATSDEYRYLIGDTGDVTIFSDVHQVSC